MQKCSTQAKSIGVTEADSKDDQGSCTKGGGGSGVHHWQSKQSRSKKKKKKQLFVGLICSTRPIQKGAQYH